MQFEAALVIPDEELTLATGAVAPWANSTSQYYTQTLESLARHFKVSLATPWKDLPDAVRNTILHGSGKEVIPLRFSDGNRTYETNKPFEGLLPNLERRWKETESAWHW